MNDILKQVLKIERLVKGNKLKRFLLHPFKYSYIIIFRYFIYPKTKKSIIKSVKTFFDTRLEVVLPASSDIFLFKGKTHDSEIRLTRFLINKLKPADTFVDIGAHIGYFTLLGSKLVGEKGKVYTFEASQNIYKVLNKNVDSYKNIFPFHKAISNKSGIINFYEFPVLFSEYNSLFPEQFKNEKWFKKFPPNMIEVNSITFNKFAYENSIKPDLIKIDVEGAEHKVIEGAINFLSEFSPIVIMEYLKPERHNEEHKKAVELLNKLNYSSYFISSDGNLKACNNVESHLENSKLESDNFVFIKHFKD